MDNPHRTVRQTVQTLTGYEDREDVLSGPLYHGGRPNRGGEITKGRKSNSWGDEGAKSTHNYFTTDLGTARQYAEQVPKGRVYEVEPTGPVKKDYAPADYKTPHPLNITREVPREEWDPQHRKEAAMEPPLRLHDEQWVDDRQVQGRITAVHPDHGTVGHLDYLTHRGQLSVRHLAVTRGGRDTGEALLDRMVALHPRVRFPIGGRTAALRPFVREAVEGPPGHEWRATLPPEHEDVVRAYEKHSPGMSTQQRAQFRKIVKNAPEVEGPVYRGVSVKNSYGYQDKIEKAHQVGGTVKIPKAVSVSTRPEVAAGYGHTVYEIHGAHGARALGNGLHEAIMPPGKYRIHSAEWRDTDSQANIDESTRYSAPRHHVVLHPVEDRTAARDPHERIFGPTHGLDKRLWSGEVLKSAVRGWVLATLDGFWRPLYGPQWRSWTTAVAFCGSEASTWTSESLVGNGDFDTLLNIDHDRFRQAVSGFLGMTDEEIDRDLNASFQRDLIPHTTGVTIPVDGEQTGPWDVTFFVAKPIASIKPYAAYELLTDTWIVKPPTLPDWNIESFPQGHPMVQEIHAVAAEIRAVLKMPEPYRSQQGDRLWHYIHDGRSQAFSDQGEGWYDGANAIEKAMVQLGLWDPLVEIHFAAHDDPRLLDAPADWSNEPVQVA